ncbi:MAG: hypothetical protein ABW185_11960 [Sedimenticola sp.]
MGPEDNKVFKHDIQKVANKNYEIYGKLTAYSLLNGGPGLPVMNKELYSVMTGGEISPLQEIDISMCLFDDETQSRLESVSCVISSLQHLINQIYELLHLICSIIWVGGQSTLRDLCTSSNVGI